MPCAWYGRAPVSPAIRVAWCVARRPRDSAVRFQLRPRRSVPSLIVPSRAGAPPPPIEQTSCLRNRFEFPILPVAEAIEAVRETERLQRVEERLASAHPVDAIPGTLGTSREADIVQASK